MNQPILREPDIYIERCRECPWYVLPGNVYFLCRIKDPRPYVIPRKKVTDRRFPRWCPLKKNPITVAALRKVIK